MARNLDVINVIDIEATCWLGHPPPGEEHEIIEIGISTIKRHSLEIEKSTIIVKPIKSKISDFCVNLTGLTQSDVDRGILFQEACFILRKQYQSRQRLWVSWGDYDRRQFERQCKDELKVSYPFGPSHINLKNLFSMMYGHSKEFKVIDALELLEIELEGRCHSGKDDAYNIAKILVKMLKHFDYGR